jgi:hypothetical protein
MKPDPSVSHSRLATVTVTTPAHHWFAAGQNDRAEPYWLRTRHRMAHWQEQLDAPADYLESNAGEVVPLSGARGFTSCIE